VNTKLYLLAVILMELPQLKKQGCIVMSKYRSLSQLSWCF